MLKLTRFIKIAELFLVTAWNNGLNTSEFPGRNGGETYLNSKRIYMYIDLSEATERRGKVGNHIEIVK